MLLDQGPLVETDVLFPIFLLVFEVLSTLLLVLQELSLLS